MCIVRTCIYVCRKSVLFYRAIEFHHRKKFEITVSVYMLELYNDKLIDLFQAQKEISFYTDGRYD